MTPSTSFSCRRLNSTTFLIIEDDSYGEYPFIYVKIYESAIVLIDTGCNASKDPNVQLKTLRVFIESYPIAENGDEPLNTEGKKGYVVICTHCHFDHIGAIEQFTANPAYSIWASSYKKDFVRDPETLPTHSLCRFFDIRTPRYKVTHWADDGAQITYGSDGVELGLTAFHAPGHTPDSLVVWDEGERVLFVGDTAYEWAPILFPVEGDVVVYKRTLDKLRRLVKGLNAGCVKGDIKRVTMASGHVTSDTDAEHFLDEVDAFLNEIGKGKLKSKPFRQFRDEQEVLYERGDGRISFAGPNRKFESFIKRD